MVEGYSTKRFTLIRSMLYSDSKLLHVILKKLTQASYLYLIKQIEEGADVIKIFDSWGGILGKKQFLEYSLYYMKYMVDKIKAKYPEIPIIIFVKNSGLYVDEISKLNINAISLDWTADIYMVKKFVMDKKIALQGNLDPAVLYGNDTSIEQNVKNCINQFKGAKGYIFNLGHGIYPDINPEKIKFLISVIRDTEV
jgi:uroporphyrinogen decarboxylase